MASKKITLFLGILAALTLAPIFLLQEPFRFNLLNVSNFLLWAIIYTLVANIFFYFLPFEGVLTQPSKKKPANPNAFVGFLLLIFVNIVVYLGFAGALYSYIVGGRIHQNGAIFGLPVVFSIVSALILKQYLKKPQV